MKKPNSCCCFRYDRFDNKNTKIQWIWIDRPANRGLLKGPWTWCQRTLAHIHCWLLKCVKRKKNEMKKKRFSFVSHLHKCLTAYLTHITHKHIHLDANVYIDIKMPLNLNTKLRRRKNYCSWSGQFQNLFLFCCSIDSVNFNNYEKILA